MIIVFTYYSLTICSIYNDVTSPISDIGSVSLLSLFFSFSFAYKSSLMFTFAISMISALIIIISHYLEFFSL